MDKNFKLTVNQKFNFEISESELQKTDVIQLESSHFHLLKNHKSFNISVIEKDFHSKTYILQINHNKYQVSIADDLDLLIQKMGISKNRSKLINQIKAPMPGLILEINVQVGQEVKENDSLLILEAMKMENNFLSPRNGIIKSIAVEKGLAVEKGQLLIEFE